jgi:monooxygenase
VTDAQPYDVVIVGAGISGIGMAARLGRDLPEKRYAVLERRAQLGGTWDLFRYPGVRSDSDMFTLGYDFAPWRDARSIGPGEAILDYLQDVATSEGVLEHIRFGHTVRSADWDSAAGLWRLTCERSDGTLRIVEARFLFLGSGYYDYDEPYDAGIPGLDSFAGSVIHPQHWPAGADYAGRQVVVIGSGATAVTLVPAMAESAAKVTMLQRTPTWYLVMPTRDRLSNLIRKLLPASWAHRLIRLKNALLQAMFVGRSRSKPEAVKRFLRRQLIAHLGPDYHPADFTPPYGPWEQRMCLVPDGDLFEAIKAGRAEIVTGRISQVETGGITLEDGRHLPAEVIVTATGLKLSFLGKIALSLDGRPIDITRHYYYRNCMFSNVPNLAALFGYLSAGWTLRVDLVTDYLTRLLAQMDAWNVQVATPYLARDHDLEDDDVFGAFSSGYIERGRHLIPRSATRAPWRISMDYLADRRDMREAPIDDGVLRFHRVGRRHKAREAPTSLDASEMVE